MFKRVLAIALAVSFVSPVVAEQAPQEAKASLTGRVLAPAVLAAAIIGSVYAADSRYNDGKALQRVAELAKRIRGSNAYKPFVARATAASKAGAATAQAGAAVVQGTVVNAAAYKAAANYAARAWSRVPAVHMPALPHFAQKQAPQSWGQAASQTLTKTWSRVPAMPSASSLTGWFARK